MSNMWPNSEHQQLNWDSESMSESESDQSSEVTLSDLDCISLSSDAGSDAIAEMYAKRYSYTPEPSCVSGPIAVEPGPNDTPIRSPLIITYLCTGPKPAEYVRNDRRSSGLIVTQRQRRRATRSSSVVAVNPQLRTYSTQDSQLDSMHNKYFNFTRKSLTIDIIDQMKLLVFDFGVSQQMKIIEKFKSNAPCDVRLQTFVKCHKTLMQSVLALCESGLFYVGNGSDDAMLCYCCGTTFMDWEHKVDPWTNHALLSPECPFLLLSKGKYFVECVQEAHSYIMKCAVPAFQKIFYDVFDDVDLYMIDDSLGEGDLKRRSECVNPMVSVCMKKSFPDLVGPVIVDLNKVPLPMNITCKICLKEKIEVLFIPCGHIFTCVQCAVTLSECSVCRETFTSSTYALRVFIVEEDSNDDGESTNNESSDEPYGNALCRVCETESIDVVYVPCRHVHTCYRCAITSDSCPVCSEPFVGLIQAFL